jgi:hypothetical protein
MMRQLCVILLICALMLPLAAQEATPSPDAASLAVMTFTLQTRPLSGIVPVEWDVMLPGTAVRDAYTYLVHLHIPDTPVEQAVLPLLATMNLNALPAASSTIAGQLLEWSVYLLRYEVEQAPLRVALAVSAIGDDTIIIGLQSTPADFDALYDDLFLPALDVFGLEPAAIRASLHLPALDPLDLPEFQIRTLAPAGWLSVNPGSFLRATDATDLTTLLIQSSDDLSGEQFAALLLQQLNLTVQLPEQPDQFAGVHLNWSLFEIQLAMQPDTVVLQLAYAQDEQRSYLVALFSTAQESASLRAEILLPILSSTRPASDQSE